MNQPVAISVQPEVITDRPPLIASQWHSGMRKTALGLFKSSAGTSALKETIVFTYSGWKGRNAITKLTVASTWVASQCPRCAKMVPSTNFAGFQLSSFHRQYVISYSYQNSNSTNVLLPNFTMFLFLNAQLLYYFQCKGIIREEN